MLVALVAAEDRGLSLNTAFAKECLALGLDRVAMDECKARLVAEGLVEVRVETIGIGDSIVMALQKVTDGGVLATRA